MDETLKLEVVHANQLTPKRLVAIHALFQRAYQEDLEPLFRAFADTTHVIDLLGTVIVSRAMWVTRWLQPGNDPPL